jgi:hypothetical protein
MLGAPYGCPLQSNHLVKGRGKDCSVAVDSDFIQIGCMSQSYSPGFGSKRDFATGDLCVLFKMSPVMTPLVEKSCVRTLCTVCIESAAAHVSAATLISAAAS